MDDDIPIDNDYLGESTSDNSDEEDTDSVAYANVRETCIQDEDVSTNIDNDSPRVDIFNSDTEDAINKVEIDNSDIPAPIIGDGTLEWVVKFNLTREEITRKELKKSENFSVRYRGVDWVVLMRSSDSQGNDFDIYAGYLQINPEEKSHIYYNIEISFSLLDEDFNQLIQSETSQQNIQFIEDVTDRGIDHCFKLGRLILSDYLNKSFSKYGYYHFIIKAKLKLWYMPQKLFSNYDSKQMTDMMLYHINSFRKVVYSLPHDNEIRGSSTTLALQSVFKNLQTSDREVSTQELLSAFGWTSQDAFAQQDVQEMMRILLDKLEDKMKNTKFEDFIKSLFAGKIKSYIKCKNVEFESNREEEFYDIQLDVKGCKNIEESFIKYCSTEILDGENCYDAGTQYGKQVAIKGVTFLKFPPVLTILLKRFDFDLNLLRFIKIHDYYEFPLNINLDKYLSDDSNDKINNIPNNYVLHSVLVHTGDVGGGHYYAFIRPSIGYNYGKVFEGNNITMNEINEYWPISKLSDINLPYSEKSQRDGKWFKFNDEIVLEVTENEAVNCNFGRQRQIHNIPNPIHLLSSAYMLVYIKESEAKDIMRDLTYEDIPLDLMQHLQNDAYQIELEQRKLEKHLLLKSFQYVNEFIISNFKNISKSNDFINDKEFQTINYISHSTLYSMIFKLSKHLNFNPFFIRLWNVNYAIRSRFGLRVIDEVNNIDLERYINDSQLYYIENILFTINNYNNEINLIDFNNKCMKYYDEFIEKESIWLNKIINETNEDNEFVGLYGIGCNNDILYKYIKNSEIKTFLQQEINLLSLQFCDIYKQLKDELVIILTNLSSNKLHKQIDSKILNIELSNKIINNIIKNREIILFLKIFDPYNILTNNSNINLYDNHPIKYLGSYRFSLSNECKDITAISITFIQSYLLQNYNEQTKDYLINIYKNHLLKYYIRGVSNYEFIRDTLTARTIPTTNSQLDTAISSPNKREENTLIGSLVNDPAEIHCFNIIFELDPKITYDVITKLYPNHENIHKLYNNPLPFEIKTLEQYLDFISVKKTFKINCFNPIDNYICITSHITTSKESESKSIISSSNDTESDISEDDRENEEIIGHVDWNKYSSLIEKYSQYISANLDIHPQKKLNEVFIHIYNYFLLSNDNKRNSSINYNNIFLYVCTEKEFNNNTVSLYKVFPLLPNPQQTFQDHIQSKQNFRILQHNNNNNITPQYFNSSSYRVLLCITPFFIINNNISLTDKLKFYEIFILNSSLIELRQAYLKHHYNNCMVLKKKRKISGTILDEANYKEWKWAAVNENTITIPKEFIFKNIVYSRTLNSNMMGEYLPTLRKEIGIPLNISITSEPIINSNDKSDYSLSIESRVMAMIGSEIRSERIYDVISDYPSAVTTYPLAFCCIKDNIIVEVKQARVKSQVSYHSWLDGYERYSNYTFGIQHIPIHYIPFMRNEVPGTRSMIVSVFYFTLLGNTCNSIDLINKNPPYLNPYVPFLCYIKDNDTYEDICRRFNEITGESEEECLRYRLAVVHSKSPHFIPKTNDNNEVNQSITPWSVLMKYYSNYGDNIYTKARKYAIDQVKQTQGDKYHDEHIGAYIGYPNIGIQKSAVTTASNNRYSRNQSIKISG